METVNRFYPKYVDDIIEKYNEIIPLAFENYNVGLPHREFIIVVYAMLLKRPKNRQLATILWDYVRYTDKPVPSYIHSFAEERYFDLVFEPNSSEAAKVGRQFSNAGESVFRSTFKGYVYAVNTTTLQITPLISMSHMKEHGFNPKKVYECIYGNAYTHKGHVFIRDWDESHKEIKDKILKEK